MKKVSWALAVCSLVAVCILTVPAFCEPGSEVVMPASPATAISPEAVRELQIKKADFILLDARSPQVYKAEHIAGALEPLMPEFYEKQALFQANVIQAPPDTDDYLRRSMKSYSQTTKFVTYCNGGCHASEILANKLKRLGFSDVQFMDGGIDAWKQKGYPVVSTVAVPAPVK